MYKIISLISIALTFLNLRSFGQNFDHYYKNKLEITLGEKGGKNNPDYLLNLAKVGNPNNFLVISYFINSNNVNYQRTRDNKYLNYNLKLLKVLASSGEKVNKSNKWVARVSKKDINYKMDGKEFMLYEGYLFRYVLEFLYISKQNISASDRSLILQFCETNFLKWHNRSIDQHGDLSLFLGARIHMGALWGNTALFLKNMSDNSAVRMKASQVYSLFNKALKNNLKVYKSGNYSCYVWNSTYDVDLTKYLSSDSFRSWNKNAEIQDISHGNHIIQFVIDCVKQNEKGWSNRDLAFFSNTLRFNLWNKSSFNSLVNGGKATSPELFKSFWKVSDGWMKLIQYDSSLKSIF